MPEGVLLEALNVVIRFVVGGFLKLPSSVLNVNVDPPGIAAANPLTSKVSLEVEISYTDVTGSIKSKQLKAGC